MIVNARPQTDLAVMLDLIRGGMDSASDLAKAKEAEVMED